MPENKGKPSGKVAAHKNDAGRQGDVKQIGPTAGARKKRPSARIGERGVTGTIGSKKRENETPAAKIT